MKRRIADLLLPALDVVLTPFTLLAAIWLKAIRRGGVQRLRASRAVLRAVGVFPVRDHYYEPLFDPRHLHRPLDAPRALPGIRMDDDAQLALLAGFRFQDELRSIPMQPAGPAEFGYDNPNFRAGDAEFLYCMIRHFRPARVLEIGSGMSTLVARLAIDANRREDPGYRCAHTCVEPYEMAWLERIPGISVVRDRVESMPHPLFEELGANDILFIDSSHVIRPQGDVLTEYLDILPRLAPGVFVHVHDIFTPRDYPAVWLVDQVRLWNEQYLLEAFMCHNHAFRVVAALNHLRHSHRDALGAALPVFGTDPDQYQPGSFWMQRVA